MKQRKVRVVWNHECVKCDEAHNQMVNVGSLYFCRDCFQDEFIASWDHKEEEWVFGIDNSTQNCIFIKWLKVYAQQMKDEAEQAMKEL